MYLEKNFFDDTAYMQKQLLMIEILNVNEKVANFMLFFTWLSDSETRITMFSKFSSAWFICSPLSHIYQWLHDNIISVNKLSTFCLSLVIQFENGTLAVIFDRFVIRLDIRKFLLAFFPIPLFSYDFYTVWTMVYFFHFSTSETTINQFFLP